MKLDKLKAVIFDLDDTLVYSREGYKERSLGMALKKLNVPYTQEDINRIWFDCGRDSYLARFGITNVEVFWDAFKEFDSENRGKNTLVFHDTPDILRVLREKEKKLGIVTSSYRKVAEDEITWIGRDNFDSVVCACFSEGIKPKPDPMGIHKCLRELEVDKDNTIYVGNAIGDLDTAKRAGVKSVLLVRDGNVPDNASDFNPIAIINSLTQLQELV